MMPIESSDQTPRVPYAWALTAFVSVLVVAQILLVTLVVGSSSPAWVLAALGLASALPMLAMGRWPWPAFVCASIAACMYGFVGASASLTWVGPIVGVYMIAGRYGRSQGVTSAVVAALALGVPGAVGLTAVGAGFNIARMLVLSGAAMAFGEANRERRARMAEAELRAEQAELARASEAALIVDEERLRIARELHDVTAHSLSVIAIQSELARKTLRSRPDAALQAVEAIGEVSRQSLGELRTMLGQLRSGSDGDRIVASLALVGDLIDALVLAGCAVDSDIGPLGNAPPFVDATAFRIMQEATTNIIRHAPGSAVKVRVGVHGGEIFMEMVNTIGHESASQQGGHGLTGMRERALALGGRVTAGPSTGVWSVSARLPLNVGHESEGA
jgi:signal transduction histidine kinase